MPTKEISLLPLNVFLGLHEEPHSSRHLFSHLWNGNNTTRHSHGSCEDKRALSHGWLREHSVDVNSLQEAFGGSICPLPSMPVSASVKKDSFFSPLRQTTFPPPGSQGVQHKPVNLDCALFTDVVIPENPEAYVKLTENAIRNTSGRHKEWDRAPHAALQQPPFSQCSFPASHSFGARACQGTAFLSSSRIRKLINSKNMISITMPWNSFSAYKC